MGDHCVVTHNGPAYLGTEMVEDRPAGGQVFLDDELGGFDNKEDG
jgi:hypothetical protein